MRVGPHRPETGSGKSIAYTYDLAGNLVQFSQPAPALLATVVSPKQIKLSWRSSSRGFVLERSPALTLGAGWSTAGLAEPTIEGSFQSVTVEIDSGAKFFRLRKF